MSAGKAWPARVDPLLVQHHQLLGDLADRGPDPGLGPLPVRPVEPAEGGRLAPGVGPQQVDLVGRDVQLVAALVLEQQVVALDPADRPADHAAEAAHAVLVVHDVGAGGDVVEEGLGVAGPGPGPAVGPAPPGEVALGQHRQLQGRVEEAPFEGLDHDPDARVR